MTDLTPLRTLILDFMVDMPPMSARDIGHALGGEYKRENIANAVQYMYEKNIVSRIRANNGVYLYFPLLCIDYPGPATALEVGGPWR